MTKKPKMRSFSPNLVEARRHLAALDNERNAQFTFQTFADDHNADKQKNNDLTRIIHGSFDKLEKRLTWLNRAGAGIFVTVNKTDGKGRKEENIKAIRSVFADKDDGPLPSLPIEPSLIIESKNGDHPYWFVDHSTTKDQFKAAQKAIIHQLKSDKRVCDPPRVLRLAGFFHLKNPNDPFLVKIKSSTGAKYTIGDIFEAFPQPPEAPKPEKNQGRSTSNDDVVAHFKKWADELPIQKGGANPFGGRNCTLLNLIREGLGCGVQNEIITEVAHAYCDRSKEERATADKMLTLQREQHSKSPFASFFIKKESKYSANAVADFYLMDRNLVDGEFKKLRFYKEDFYRYHGDRYAKMSRSDLRADLMSFLQTSSALRESHANINFANNVLANIEGKTFVSETTDIPSFLSCSTNSKSRLIAMKNGIFDVDFFMGLEKFYLLPHTPDYFSTSCLPFEYSPNAKSPKWISFLKKMLPDPEVQMFLQEWFGYNLVFDSRQQAFVLFVGEGANGKTVVCVVLRSLLGKENISAVGLEQFNPVRTFPLAAMVGKLANIVEEIGEVDKVAEGILKDFVSGGVMTIERKNKDAFETTAKARLTFATNVLPRFKDRSGGLWRRMIPIPFEVQILDPAEQNKNLVDPDWWENSGELPGIMNWAIKGLVRLSKQGQFTLPKVALERRNEYREEANPAAAFLLEHCSVQNKKVTSSTRVYRHYSRWMQEQNGRPLGAAQFTREVKKVFPNATLSTNAKYQPNGTRAREWEGIGWINGEPCHESTGEAFP